jgi:lytic murein transglycosylase
MICDAAMRRADLSGVPRGNQRGNPAAASLPAGPGLPLLRPAPPLELKSGRNRVRGETMHLGRIGAALATALLAAMPLAAVAAPASCGNDSSGFAGWVQGFKQDAIANGISERTTDAALTGVRYSTATIALDRNQKVFKQSFEQFSGRMIPPRMGRAKAMLQKYSATFDKIEKQFGVPRQIVVAIWGLETDFGAVSNAKVSVISAVATLAYDCRRSDFFRGQLVDALRVIDRGDLTPAQMVGGLHGEIGQTQFLPSSYAAFAVDFDGNGHADLIHSSVDVLASTANYMRGHGWQKGAGWMPGQPNFAVIKEWNKSDVYARTVAEFATRLAGG